MCINTYVEIFGQKSYDKLVNALEPLVEEIDDLSDIDEGLLLLLLYYN